MYIITQLLQSKALKLSEIFFLEFSVVLYVASSVFLQ